MKMDLKRAEFSLERKGYSPAQVDEYITGLLSAYEALEKEYAELDKKYRAAVIKLEEAKNEESTISTIIVSAQKMADSIIKDAKEKAGAVNAALSESCDELLADYTKKTREEQIKLKKARKAVEEFKNSLYNAYKGHLSAIEMILPDDEIEAEIPEKDDETLAGEAMQLAREKYENAGDDVEIISKGN